MYRIAFRLQILCDTHNSRLTRKKMYMVVELSHSENTQAQVSTTQPSTHKPSKGHSGQEESYEFFKPTHISACIKQQ
jgi:hypothetical protein